MLLLSALPAARIWPSANQELEPSPRTLVCWHHDLGLLASIMERSKQMPVAEAPLPLHGSVVTAAQADRDAVTDALDIS